MSKQPPVLHRMFQLRLLVGTLGERVGWWPSRFTDEIAARRMGALFPRTWLRAMLESVTLAARRDHDPQLRPDAIHLFRLAGVQEDAIAHHLAQDRLRLSAPPSTRDQVLAELDGIGRPEAGP